MAEYHALSVLTGLVELALAWRIFRSNQGALWLLLLFLYWDGVGHLLPAEPYNPLWWRAVWTPVAVLRLGLTIGVSADLFRLLTRRTYRNEQALLIHLGGATAGAVILVASWWGSATVPENWFQAFGVARQYLLVGLAAGTTGICRHLLFRRATDQPLVVTRHALLWCGWLWLSFVGASTVQGGMLWRLMDWEESAWLWPHLGTSVRLLQLGLLAGWWVSLRGTR